MNARIGYALSIGLVAGLLMVNDAHAQSNAFATCDPGPPTVLSIAPIDIPPNAVVGQVLGNPNGYPFDLPNAMRCTYDPNFVIDYWSFMTISNQLPYTGFWRNADGFRMPVYRSGLIGVGIGMIAQDRDVHDRFEPVGGMTTLRSRVKPGIPSWGVRGRLYFFVTGVITGGQLPAKTIGSLHVYSAYQVHDITIGATRIGPPRKPTCQVSTPSLALNLGQVSAQLFQGKDSVAASATATGSITLECSGGTGAAVDVLITLTDQTNPANRSDRLSLTSSSTARGVALQLLHGSRLLSYGEDSSRDGNPNQWLAGSTDNGLFTIPLTARYIQTGTFIQPGTANGIATFTMSYR